MVKQTEDNGKENNGLIQRKFLGQCNHIKKDGNRCRAIASKESGLCSIHSGLVPRLEGEIDLTESLTHVKKFLGHIAMQLKRGRMKSTDVNALTQVCNTLLKIFEMEEVLKYLEDTKEKMKSTEQDYSIPADYTRERL